MQPTISVILPVYNGEKYLAEAIESVLAQSFKSFELIIINDGSKDNSLSIIKRYMSQDERIKLINRDNKGLVYSLNEGIKQAQGEFIARMDADDICLPTRFEEQINYMQIHKLDLCGSWIQPFTEDRILPIRKYPESHEDITITMIFFNCLAHPSMMIRSNVFTNLSYDNEVAEDYQLWCNTLVMGYRVGNIPRVLLKYREHAQQITKNNLVELDLSVRKISNNFAAQLGPIESLVAKNTKLLLINHKRASFLVIADLLEQLISQYNANFHIQSDILLWLYNKSQPKTPWLYYQYKKKSNIKNIVIKEEAKLILKSFLYLPPESNLLNKIKVIYQKIS